MGALAGRLWLMPVILATLEAEIWRIEVWGQSGQIVQKTSSPEQNGLEVAQVGEHLFYKSKALRSNCSPTRKTSAFDFM
jgi:hypothetical protein